MHRQSAVHKATDVLLSFQSSSAGPASQRASTLWLTVALDGVASELLEVGSSRSGGGGGDASSAAGKQGMLVAIRCMEVGLVGEKGSKVPNFALQELSLEMDFQLSLSWQYNPCASSIC